jgi:peroxiredoxin
MYRMGREAIGRQEMTETSGDPREGRRMENFELPDHGLLPFDLYQALEEGPLVLVFYRGDW